TTLDTSDEAGRAGAGDIFAYAHASVRDEDYPLGAKVQANMEAGGRPQLVFGRNEPGLQHPHASMGTAPGGSHDDGGAARSVLPDAPPTSQAGRGRVVVPTGGKPSVRGRRRAGRPRRG